MSLQTLALPAFGVLFLLQTAAYSCVEFIKMASTPSQATAVPLRPELFEFIGVQGLGRLACCSSALREELRDAKAWQLLANATTSRRSKRETELAAERDAAARVRSHVLRRRLADVASGKVKPRPFHPNKFSDFTYFVRFEEDGEVIWETDLKGSLDEEGNLIFSLSEAWSAMKNNVSSASMATFLTTSTDDDINGDSDVYLQRISITVVAMRNEDKAMVTLGHLVYDGAEGVVGDPDQIYVFASRIPLLSLDSFQLMITAVLDVTHDNAHGIGTLDSLSLDLERQGLHGQDTRLCWPRQFEYALSYLAGVHHQARDDVYETIAGWRNAEITHLAIGPPAHIAI